jgi:membrane-associated phospholipid phosphatase
MRKRLAKLISSVLNPFLVSFLVIVLLAFHDTTSTAEALKWTAISLVLSVLPVFIVVVYLARQGKLDGILVIPQEQRTGIYVLAAVLGAIGCAVLYFLGAPELLVATFCAGLVAVVIFMVINMFWKISLHAAFISGSATVLTIIYGMIGALSILLLLLVAWARIELKLHSPAQVAGGTLLAAAILIVVYQLFGVTGW